ncbi:MAG: chemotaxis protein CheW [Candidatus Gastranaerophilaceae bacterium]|jgi:purine-binding chemotaxis protein CheW
MSNELKFKNDELQMVVFKLEDEEYSVPISLVQEIIMPQKTTHLPKSPVFIEGVINLRGHIIPIIDGRKRFNLKISEQSNDTRIIVIELENHAIGLIVDSVSEVVNLKSENIEPTPIDTEENSFIQGIGKYKNRLLILLDLTNFLNIHEAESLQNTVQIAKNIFDIKKQMENPPSKTENLT